MATPPANPSPTPAAEEQAGGLTWKARADHAAGLYARTVIERDDALTEVEQLRARLGAIEQICSGRPGFHTIAVMRLLTAMGGVNDAPTTADHPAHTAEQAAQEQRAGAEFDQGTVLLVGEQVTAYAAAIRDAALTEAADSITALGKARSWSIWAADYIHPNREFVDTDEDDDLEQPALAAPDRPAVEVPPSSTTRSPSITATCWPSSATPYSTRPSTPPPPPLSPPACCSPPTPANSPPTSARTRTTTAPGTASTAAHAVCSPAWAALPDCSTTAPTESTRRCTTTTSRDRRDSTSRSPPSSRPPPYFSPPRAPPASTPSTGTRGTPHAPSRPVTAAGTSRPETSPPPL
ncbi:hypothetical protein [Streptomyces sp. NPDC088141]|uniref:hypothetical protein n=1 Tax=unclassified Streptomyces TaxID=2593676 RepID=UPI0034338E42